MGDRTVPPPRRATTRPARAAPCRRCRKGRDSPDQLQRCYGLDRQTTTKLTPSSWPCQTRASAPSRCHVRCLLCTKAGAMGSTLLDSQ
eukprot:gene7451-biopygen21047